MGNFIFSKKTNFNAHVYSLQNHTFLRLERRANTVLQHDDAPLHFSEVLQVTEFLVLVEDDRVLAFHFILSQSSTFFWELDRFQNKTDNDSAKLTRGSCLQK